MDVKQFVKDLTASKPNLKKLMIASGLDEQNAKQIQESWDCIRREGKYINYSNPLEELIHNFSTRGLIIDDVSIYDFLIEKDWGFLFAGYQDLDLAYETKSQEVIWYDDEAEQIILPVAKSAEAFLKLLLECSNLTAKMWEGIALVDNEQTQFLENAIEIAGGEKYEKFVRLLLQINPPTTL